MTSLPEQRVVDPTKVSPYDLFFDSRKPTYEWRIYGTKAVAVMQELLPYIRSTRVRDKMLLALEAQATREHASSYHQRMAVLNARGRR